MPPAPEARMTEAGSGERVGARPVRRASGALSARDRWDHVLARWGVDRGGHRVAPGLYALGSPDARSPVFVTANYTLSFDALRGAVSALDCYILVLDTKGINVWCAAGKGTFGTDELVERIESVDLAGVVEHRSVIAPQLGATGIAAHEVRARSGFRVEYGPVRAADIPEYLDEGRATGEMRRVRFGLADRLSVVPVELVHAVVPLIVVSAGLYLAAGAAAAWAGAACILAGVALFPTLLPWIPSADFTTKGLILGVTVALPFAVARVAGSAGPWWWGFGWGVVHLLGMVSVTAFLALIFTGSTTFASRTGVELEIKRYTRPLVGLFALGVLLSIALPAARAILGQLR